MSIIQKEYLNHLYTQDHFCDGCPFINLPGYFFLSGYCRTFLHPSCADMSAEFNKLSDIFDVHLSPLSKPVLHNYFFIQSIFKISFCSILRSKLPHNSSCISSEYSHCRRVSAMLLQLALVRQGRGIPLGIPLGIPFTTTVSPTNSVPTTAFPSCPVGEVDTASARMHCIIRSGLPPQPARHSLKKVSLICDDSTDDIDPSALINRAKDSSSTGRWWTFSFSFSFSPPSMNTRRNILNLYGRTVSGHGNGYQYLRRQISGQAARSLIWWLLLLLLLLLCARRAFKEHREAISIMWEMWMNGREPMSSRGDSSSGLVSLVSRDHASRHRRSASSLRKVSWPKYTDCSYIHTYVYTYTQYLYLRAYIHISQWAVDKYIHAFIYKILK